MKLFLLPLLLLSLRANEPALVPDGNLITVYTQFAQAPSEAIVEQMKAELDTLMLPAGVRFDWRDLSSANGRDSMAEILVVNFRGGCVEGTILALAHVSGPLGWTHVSDREILPFTEVNCD